MAAVWAADPDADTNLFYDTFLSPDSRNKYHVMRQTLGTPAYKKPLTSCQDRTSWPLWELYEGFNPTMSRIVNEDFLKTGSWIVKLYPQQELEGTELKLISYYFEPEVMPSISDQGVNPVIQGHVEQELFTTDTKGLSFEMPADSVFSEIGLRSFAEKTKVLETSMDDTLSHDVMDVTMTAGRKQYLESLPPKPWSEAEFIAILRDTATNFASIQKGRASATVARGVQLLADQHITPTDEIYPSSQAIRFIKNADRIHTTFAKGGPLTADKAINSDQNVLISYATEQPMTIRAGRAFKRRVGGRHNPMASRRVFGEWYPAYELIMKNHHGNLNEKYQTLFRTVTIPDAVSHKRDFTLRTLIDHCGIFDHRGPEHAITQLGMDILHTCANWSPGRSYDGTKKRKKAKAGAPGSGGVVAPTLGELYERAAWLARIKQDYVVLGGGGAGGGAAEEAEPAPTMPPSAMPAPAELAAEGGLGAPVPLTEKEEKAPGKHPLSKKGSKRFAALLDEPVSYDNLMELVDSNVPVPLNFLIFRPHIAFEVGGLLVMRRGGDTGVLYINQVQVNFERRPKTRMIAVHVNFAALTVITRLQQRNIVLFRDAFVFRFLGGFSGDPVMPGRSTNSLGFAARHSEMQESTYIIAVPAAYDYQGIYLDKTGFVNRDLLQSQVNPVEMYPTAHIYTQMYQWPNYGVDPFTLSELTHPSVLGNSLMFKGSCRIHTPKEFELGDEHNEILGASPLGSRMGDRLFKIIAGQEDTLEDNIQRIS